MIHLDTSLVISARSQVEHEKLELAVTDQEVVVHIDADLLHKIEHSRSFLTQVFITMFFCFLVIRVEAVNIGDPMEDLVRILQTLTWLELIDRRLTCIDDIKSLHRSIAVISHDEERLSALLLDDFRLWVLNQVRPTSRRFLPHSEGNLFIDIFFDEVGEHGAVGREASFAFHGVPDDGLTLLHETIVLVLLETKQEVTVIFVVFFFWRYDLGLGAVFVGNDILAHLEDEFSIASEDARSKHEAGRNLELDRVVAHPQLLVERSGPLIMLDELKNFIIIIISYIFSFILLLRSMVDRVLEARRCIKADVVALELETLEVLPALLLIHLL